MPAEQPTPQEQPDKITDLPQRAETDASGVADQIKGGEGVAKNLKAVGDTQNNLAGALKA